MGRLFWKIFFAFFIALISTALIVGNLVHWEVLFQHGLIPPNPNLTSTPANTAKHVIYLFASFPSKVLLFSLVLSAVFAGVLAWSIAHPIKLLLIQLKRAAQGNLEVQVSPSISRHHEEFVELGVAFDLMVAQLNSMIKSQSNMLHHVSHELRSPLARIQMALGLVQQDPKKVQSSLERVEMEALRMEKMIAELLEMFRLESGMQKLSKTLIELQPLLTGIVNDVRFESEHANIQLLMPTKKLLMYGQAELLHRAIENILRNAVKYGPKTGLIIVELRLSEETGDVIIAVQDEGNGVSPDEIDQIFKPFVRGRGTTQIEGHGIGLAMTKYIVEAHGGEIKAENLEPKGFTIRLELPQSEAAESSPHPYR